MPTTNIYALCEPGTLEVRYVGKAQKSLEKRWHGHLTAARRGKSSLVTKWIAGWLATGKEPTMILLAECPERMEKAVEQAWVQLFVDNGYQLLNVHFNPSQHPDHYCFNHPTQRPTGDDHAND